MNDDIIYEGDLNDTAITEMLSRRFKNLSREYLQLDLKKDSDFLSLVKDSSRFFSFSLPLPINEIFIRYEDAPLFWVYRTPLLVYLEELFKLSMPQSSTKSIHNSIKDFYTKWVMMNPGNEKKYFAASAINFIEKKANKNNFLYAILHSIILSYDNYFYNPQKSLELLDTAQDLVNDTELGDTFREEIYYLISLYGGFLFLNQKQIPSAKEKFAESLSIKPYGVSAKFYNTYTEAVLNNQILSGDIVSDLYDFDIQRMIYAIDANSISMLEYFMNNSVIGNFFYYYEFVPSVEMFANFFRDVKGTRHFDLNVIKINLTQFKDLKLSSYYTPEFEKNLAFLENVLQKYSANENILFLGASEKLHLKFKNTLEIVINEIKNKYYKEVDDKLLKFDVELQEKTRELESISKDNEGVRKKLHERMKSTIEEIERVAASNIAILEDRISNLHMIQSLDPKMAFKNAMTYNLILSVTVFMMGGCAGYSNNFLGDASKMNNAFSVIMSTGLKWGAIAFLVGFLISLISAGLAMLEGSNQKQKLLQTINTIKNEKNQQVSFVKEEGVQKEKELEEKFRLSSESKQKYVEALKTEREVQEKVYLEDAEQKIRKECAQIEALII